MNDIDEADEIFQHVYDTVINQSPFNQMLGFTIDSMSTDSVRFKLIMKNELVGYAVTGNIHGGVISTVLDAVGSVTVFMNAISRMKGPFSKKKDRVGGGITIDLRVDYLRPGKGKEYTATGYVLRTGNKVAVTRMELHNEENELIAVGTGTYSLTVRS